MHDLTHRIEPGMQTYPGDPAVTVDPVATYSEDGYRESHLSFGTHTGTHVDAPAHIKRNGKTLEDFSLDSFRRECRRIDCRKLDPREPITADRIPAVESEVDCLVIWTGWDDDWGSDRYLDHPYLTPAAAGKCANQHLAIALDTLNPDPTPSERSGPDEPDGFPAHHAILGDGQVIVENLCHLDAVTDRFELVIAPLRLDGDGAPVRAVGLT